MAFGLFPNRATVSGAGIICQLVPSQRSMTGFAGGRVALRISHTPTAMHEFADEQSTPERNVRGPLAFGVGVTVQAADVAEGVNSSAAIANKTRRNDRSDICPAEATPAVWVGQAAVAYQSRCFPCGRGASTAQTLAPPPAR